MTDFFDNHPGWGIAIIAALVLGLIGGFAWYQVDHRPIRRLVVVSKFVKPAHYQTTYILIGKVMTPITEFIHDDFVVVVSGVNKYGQQAEEERSVTAQSYATINPGDEVSP